MHNENLKVHAESRRNTRSLVSAFQTHKRTALWLVFAVWFIIVEKLFVKIKFFGAH